MRRRSGTRWTTAIAMGALLGIQLAGPSAFAGAGGTATPIKHVIVIIGENHSFDNVYATYQPKHRETIKNLLSLGIVNADGTPGPNSAIATQFSVNTVPSTYFLSVDPTNKTAYSPYLPAIHLAGAPSAPFSLTDLESGNATQPPFDNTVSDSLLETIVPTMEPSDIGLLRTGASGLGATGIDTRVTNASTLPNTSFQWTGPTFPYDSFTGSPVHRFFHMWQQQDCNAVANHTTADPAGCLKDLYPYVDIARGPDAGGDSMAFFNVQAGDAPLFKQLADAYTINDNFHQPAMGGTAQNHVELFMGDAIPWETFTPVTTPPSPPMTAPPASQIANPNPKTPGTPGSDKYKVDKEWTMCSDTSQPGVGPIISYLGTLSYPLSPQTCASGKYYMINNLSPGYLPNGQVDQPGIVGGASVPPSTLRTIGDALNDAGVSWKYYGGSYNAAVDVANGSTDPIEQYDASQYCDHCNFPAYATSLMGNPTQRAAHVKDAVDFLNDIKTNNLPAVSFVKPDGNVDGHPASGKLDLYEATLEQTLDLLQQQPQPFRDTAVFITFDEGDGSWDSGYFQPVDFFGDGPRIPLVVVSKYSKGGKVVHSYNDQVSILKFIERNWGFGPLTSRSRDNLHNPTPGSDPYVPGNSPAIGDLFDMFNFKNNN